ncbi:MAG: hypothetical protein Q7J57_14065 [Gemmobacter sp.]|nr:hypothetical protein [Gemmobacter sp.]
MTRSKTYPDGWQAVIDQWEGRRAPLSFAPGEALLAHDADLAALAAQVVTEPDQPQPPVSGYARKRHALAQEFVGQSHLALEHAVVLSALRKRGFPPHSAALFRRFWAEQTPALIAELNTRWLVSGVITFAEFGATESERMLGQSMKMLFKLLKLYEFERLFSGLDPDQPFKAGQKSKAALPMEINPFSLRDGGLDINLLAPIWKQAMAEPVMGALTCHLLDRLNDDPGTVFRRIALMRTRVLARDAKKAQQG